MDYIPQPHTLPGLSDSDPLYSEFQPPPRKCSKPVRRGRWQMRARQRYQRVEDVLSLPSLAVGARFVAEVVGAADDEAGKGGDEGGQSKVDRPNGDGLLGELERGAIRPG